MGLNKVTQYPKVFASRIDPFKTLSPVVGTKILRRAISTSSKYIVSSQLTPAKKMNGLDDLKMNIRVILISNIFIEKTEKA